MGINGQFSIFSPLKSTKTRKIFHKIVQAHRRVPPTTGVVELWQKTILQWKLLELGGVPQKMDEYFHWGPIFYVCSSARNWVPFMYKGIYHIRKSLWGAATLDVWSSSARKFPPKNRSPEKKQFLLILFLKNDFFKLTEGYTQRRVSWNYEKKYFAMKTDGIRWCSWKMNGYFD